MAADPNNAVYFPATLLFLIRPLSSAIRWSYGLWLLAFPLAAYAGLRRLRVPAFPAAASFAMAISGPVMTLTSFPHVAWASMLFLPIAALAWGAGQGSRRDALLAGLLLGIAIDIGEPVIAFHLLAAIAVFSFRRPVLAWARRVVAIAAAGALVALPQVVAAVELLPDTVRGAGLDVRYGAAFNSVRPLRLLGYLWPGLFGDVSSASPAGFWGSRFFDAGTPYVGSLAVGVAVLALLPAAARDRRGKRFLLLAGAALLLSFGRFLPAGTLLLSAPGLSILRYPEKWLFVATWSMFGAAAIGLSRLAAGREDSRRAMLAGSAAILAVSSIARLFLAALPDAGARLLVAARIVDAPVHAAGALVAIAGEISATAAFAALLLLAAGAFRRRPAWLAAAAALLLFADLFPRTWNSVPLAPASLFDEAPEAVRRVAAAGGRFYFDGETEIAADPLRPMSPAIWGVAFAGNNDVDRFSPRRSFYFGRLEESLPFSDPRKAALLRLADVRTVSTIDPSAETLPALLATSPRRTLRLLDGGERFRLFSSAIEAPSEDAARSILLDPRRDASRLVVEGSPPPSAPAGAASVLPVSRRADREEVEVDSAGGYLFRSETFDRHWRARIDGADARVVPAAFSFQAVAVPAGRHRVVFSYSDPAAAAAMAVSLAALAAMGWMLGRRGSGYGRSRPAYPVSST